MRSFDQIELQLELLHLLGSSRGGELPQAEFDARLESLHTLFFGEDAKTSEMVERRRIASKAYGLLRSGTDRQHSIEQLSKALGIESQ